MFFTECARLAERHPDLAATIGRVDAQLHEMGTAEVIRPGDFASFMGADPNQVTAILEALARDGVLLSEEMIECPHCGMAALCSECENVLEEEGEYRCTDCDRPLPSAAVRAITTYRRGKKWKTPPIPKKSTRAAEVAESPSSQTSAGITLDDRAWYTQDRLADVFEVGKEALRKRLDRYRQQNLNGWKENEVVRRVLEEPPEPADLQPLVDAREELKAPPEVCRVEVGSGEMAVAYDEVAGAKGREQARRERLLARSICPDGVADDRHRPPERPCDEPRHGVSPRSVAGVRDAELGLELGIVLHRDARAVEVDDPEAAPRGPALREAVGRVGHEAREALEERLGEAGPCLRQGPRADVSGAEDLPRRLEREVRPERGGDHVEDGDDGGEEPVAEPVADLAAGGQDVAVGEDIAHRVQMALAEFRANALKLGAETDDR